MRKIPLTNLFSDENIVRFCVGVPKDDSSASYAALDAAMDTLIENLKKAA